MKILLVCAGGFSTSILMKKMRNWAQGKGRELTVDAVGQGSYEEKWRDYDIILLGPQIAYNAASIKANVTIPVMAIPARDYGMGNVDNIMKLADEALK